MIDLLFNDINMENLALLYFSDQTCAVCDILWIKVLKAIEDYPQIVVKAIEKSSSPIAPAQLSIFQYPTAIVYYQGKEVKRFEGAYAFDELAAYIHRMMSLLED